MNGREGGRERGGGGGGAERDREMGVYGGAMEENGNWAKKKGRTAKKYFRVVVHTGHLPFSMTRQ